MLYSVQDPEEGDHILATQEAAMRATELEIASPRNHWQSLRAEGAELRATELETASLATGHFVAKCCTQEAGRIMSSRRGIEYVCSLAA